MTSDKDITRQLLLDFLIRKGWKATKSSSQFTRYIAPDEAGLDAPFEIVVPHSDSRPNLKSAFNALQDIYDLSYDELINQAIGEDAAVKHAILGLRLVGENIGHGSIGLRPFERFFGKLRKTLTDAASFEITQSPIISHSPIETISFLDSCRFLAPKEGSFILDIRIPTTTIIKQRTFFDEEITAGSITERLFAIIKFANEQVLAGNQYVLDQAVLTEQTELISLEVFRDLYELLGTSRLEDLSFSLQKGNTIRRSQTGFLSDDKMRNFERFVDFLKQNISDETEISVSGHILELHSKDPLSDRNRITLKAHNQPGDLVSISLNSSLYQEALNAHSHKRFIEIKGLCRRMKTKIKVTELHDFRVL
ncbi:hypothetical protein [Noviherbaspirillum sp.]|jgi:hypothetical protein|uniref:hypothetical protein n=1 Tax=Noviherbaspirillum sp. TaxID=1926288 RepID=UPI0025D7DCA4|nr:hypothetical protein [Noviherbaspirillum sp.]